MKLYQTNKIFIFVKMTDFNQPKPSVMSTQTNMNGPIYSQEPTAPIFEIITRASVKKQISEVKKLSPEQLVEQLKTRFDKVNKETVDQFMDLLFAVKVDKNINHNLRIQVFSKLFDCTEKDAKKYYKAFKMIWKFQHIASELEAFIKNLALSVK